MRCWLAIALVAIGSACGPAANDIVASQTDTGERSAGEPVSTSDAERDLLTPARTITEASPSATSPNSTTPTWTAPAPSDSLEPTSTSESIPPSDSEPTQQAPRLDVIEASSAAPLLGGEVFDLAGCPDTPRGAVTDKANQRYWLCADGQAVTPEIPMTTASANYGLPPVGTYPVFARDETTTGINGEPLERFIAFYTTPRGNRIAFHEVVDQDPTTVGNLDQRGASAGCFRVREADSIQVWEFLQIGDPVVVLTN